MLSIFKLAKFEKGSPNYSKRNLLNYIVIFKTWFKHWLWWNVSHYGLGTEALSQLYPSQPVYRGKKATFFLHNRQVGSGEQCKRCKLSSLWSNKQLQWKPRNKFGFSDYFRGFHAIVNALLHNCIGDFLLQYY